MGVLAAMLDALPGWRSWIIDTLVTSGVTLADVLVDDATLDAYLNKAVAGVWHPVGTCRMGRADDPLAVTTPQGRVRGVARLARVRRLGDAVDPVREHEYSDHHGGGADGGFDQGGASLTDAPVPAQAGTQSPRRLIKWIPAFAGMSGREQ